MAREKIKSCAGFRLWSKEEHDDKVRDSIRITSWPESIPVSARHAYHSLIEDCQCWHAYAWRYNRKLEETK